jgi:hypothetical protein
VRGIHCVGIHCVATARACMRAIVFLWDLMRNLTGAARTALRFTLRVTLRFTLRLTLRFTLRLTLRFTSRLALHLVFRNRSIQDYSLPLKFNSHRNEYLLRNESIDGFAGIEICLETSRFKWL